MSEPGNEDVGSATLQNNTTKQSISFRLALSRKKMVHSNLSKVGYPPYEETHDSSRLVQSDGIFEKSNNSLAGMVGFTLDTKDWLETDQLPLTGGSAKVLQEASNMKRRLNSALSEQRNMETEDVTTPNETLNETMKHMLGDVKNDTEPDMGKTFTHNTIVSRRKPFSAPCKKYNPLTYHRIEFIFASRFIKRERGDLTLRNVEGQDEPQEMEYLVKFEKRSYRDLEWVPQQCFSQNKTDPAFIKLSNFHRRMCGKNKSREIPLSSQQEVNFKLYGMIDRIIAVRLKDQVRCQSAKGRKKRHTKMNGTPPLHEKQYLVKWEYLGYADSTWENESRLKSPEDIYQILLFKQRNRSFTFPQFPSTSVQVTFTSNACIKSVIDSEDYEEPSSTIPVNTCELWETFSRYKLARDGTYRPSQVSGLIYELTQECPTPSDKTLRVGKRLMKHQQEGVRWLFYNTQIACHGSLLADEMGLGKTCQTITFLEHYLDMLSQQNAIVPHALVVVQKILVENWRREFQVWTPHLNVYPLCGKKSDRQIARLYEEIWMCEETGKELPTPPPTFDLKVKKLIKPDIVLVTYESLRSLEFDHLMKRLCKSSKKYLPENHFQWACIVVDECQKLKGGQDSILLQTLLQLNCHTTILLTGTPVQNTTKELFPLLALLNPKKFYYQSLKDGNSSSDTESWSVTQFNDHFSNLQNRPDCMQKTDELYQLIAPYILRREKANVLKTLGTKTVQVVRIPLTLIQKRVYSALYHKSLHTKGLKFSNIHMQLRKCCIHPFLIEGVEDLIISGEIYGNVDHTPPNEQQPADSVPHLNDSIPEDSVEGQPNIKQEEKNIDSEKENETQPIVSCEQDQNNQRMKSLFLESSGKFVLLKKMIEFYYKSKRKILLFSYFKSALDLIEDFLALYDYPWFIERVDGQTPGDQRQLMIDRFNTDEQRFLFLCTTRAGGLGINLSAASVVIHFDSDLNPQHDLQAQARCHRIGQDKEVDVFHFISQHTYEDYMLFSIAGKKLGLEAVLLGRLNATQGKIKLDKQQEESVLRKGVYAAIRDDDTAKHEASEFARLPIEEILRTKSTQVCLEGQLLDPSTSTNSPEPESYCLSSTPTTLEKETRHPGLPFLSTGLHTPTGHQKTFPNYLDENRPDFWIHVAQRLKPLTVYAPSGHEEKKELKREDRRRNQFHPSRVIDGTSSQETFDSRDSQRYSVESQDMSTSNKDTSDNRSRTSYATEDSRSEISCSSIDKIDEPLDGFFDLTQDRRTTDKSKWFKMLKHPSQNLLPSKNALTMPCGSIQWNNDHTAVLPSASVNDIVNRTQLTSPPLSPKHTENNLNNCLHEWATTKALSSPGTTLDHQTLPSTLDILSFVYRTLKCFLRWKDTPLGKSGTFKSDILRKVDCLAPWSLPFHNVEPDAPQKDVLQSWNAVMQEWDEAEKEWQKIVSEIGDMSSTSNAKEQVNTERSLEPHEQITQSSPLVTATQSQDPSDTHNSERRPHVSVDDRVISSLELICANLSKKAVTGKHFSRDLHSRKLVWIFGEDLCMKLIFVHFMSKLYSTGNPVMFPKTGQVMRWGHSQTAVNWTLIVEVLKKINQYTVGPERHILAIQYRFYNKLDSRWNQSEITEEEHEILRMAASNKTSAHLLAQDMLPGRTLDRVRYELRSCQAAKKSQTKEKISKPSLHANTSTLVPSVLSPQGFSGIQRTKTSAGLQHVSRDLDMKLKDDTNPLVMYTKKNASIEATGTPELSSKENLLQQLQTCLVSFGINYSAFQNIATLLQAQPIDKLAKLLHQLQSRYQHHIECLQLHYDEINEVKTKNEPMTVTHSEPTYTLSALNSLSTKNVSLTAAALELSASLQEAVSLGESSCSSRDNALYNTSYCTAASPSPVETTLASQCRRSTDEHSNSTQNARHDDSGFEVSISVEPDCHSDPKRLSV